MVTNGFNHQIMPIVLPMLGWHRRSHQGSSLLMQSLFSYVKKLELALLLASFSGSEEASGAYRYNACSPTNLNYSECCPYSGEFLRFEVVQEGIKN